jgi:uncharacterized membrane protein YeaQ/YmgE (transglycosylase-associated protein family)
MNVAMWLLAGGAVGWAGYTWLKLNARRGRVISIIIGAVAGFLGGDLLAPMLSAAMATAGDFNPLSLFTAFASAAACLVVSDMIYNHFGV